MFHIVTGVIDVTMTDLERGISLLWVVDSYWRTISTTHMGLSARLICMRIGRGIFKNIGRGRYLASWASRLAQYLLGVGFAVAKGYTHIGTR